MQGEKEPASAATNTIIKRSANHLPRARGQREFAMRCSRATSAFCHVSITTRKRQPTHELAFGRFKTFLSYTSTVE
jgi:hypothetical protein